LSAPTSTESADEVLRRAAARLETEASALDQQAETESDSKKKERLKADAAQRRDFALETRDILRRYVGDLLANG
jgi:hypothetical protein